MNRKITGDAPSLLLIAAAGLLAYMNALSNTFAWDDIYLVVKNPYIKGWQNIPHLFTSGYWESIGKTGGLYRPLTMLSFLAEHSVSGLNPFIYHLDNVLLHIACSLLVYFLVRDLVEYRHAPLIAAVLFAVHPVHTEAVAWVSGRAELLACLFFLLALLGFIRRWGGGLWYLVSPGLFLLGVLAKETAAMLPAVVFLYMLLVVKERGPAGYLRALAPYAVVLVVYVPVRMIVLGGYTGPAQTEQMFANVKVYYIFLTMAKAGLNYLRLMAFPTGLQAVYLFPPPESIFTPPVILFLALFAISLFTAYRLSGSRRVVSLFILWFIVCLLPVSNIAPTEIIMSERALYLPSAGLCGLAGYLFSMGLSAVDTGGTGVRRLYVTSIAVVMLAFVALSVERNTVWKDESSFAAERVKVHSKIARQFPEYTLNSLRLADAYGQLGRPDRARAVLAGALQLEPDNLDARLQLAALLKDEGELEAALEQLLAASRIPGCPRDRIYTDIASTYFMQGQAGKAEKYLMLAMEENPDGPLQNLNYGILLLERGEKEAALAYFTRAAELDPHLFAAFLEQGILLGEMGNFQDAARILEKAVDIEPGNPEARLYLGAAYMALGQNDAARGELVQAMRLRPGYPEAEALLESIR